MCNLLIQPSETRPHEGVLATLLMFNASTLASVFPCAQTQDVYHDASGLGSELQSSSNA